MHGAQAAVGLGGHQASWKKTSTWLAWPVRAGMALHSEVHVSKQPYLETDKWVCMSGWRVRAGNHEEPVTCAQVRYDWGREGLVR